MVGDSGNELNEFDEAQSVVPVWRIVIAFLDVGDLGVGIELDDVAQTQAEVVVCMAEPRCHVVQVQELVRGVIVAHIEVHHSSEWGFVLLECQMQLLVPELLLSEWLRIKDDLLGLRGEEIKHLLESNVQLLLCLGNILRHLILDLGCPHERLNELVSDHQVVRIEIFELLLLTDFGLADRHVCCDEYSIDCVDFQICIDETGRLEELSEVYHAHARILWRIGYDGNEQVFEELVVALQQLQGRLHVVGAL